MYCTHLAVFTLVQSKQQTEEGLAKHMWPLEAFTQEDIAISVYISLRKWEGHQILVNNNRVSQSRFDLIRFYKCLPFLVNRLTHLSY